MRKFLVISCAFVFTLTSMSIEFVQGASPTAVRSLEAAAQEDNQPRVLRVPQRRRRRVRGDRRRGRGIGAAYARAGRSAGRGGARFGRNIARGRPIRAGRELGRGMGSFGRHTGVGTARVGRRIGRTTRRIFTGR
jgi:hypothetical protein